MTIRAVVVGIDKYEEPDWDRDGPVSNACAVANWLLSIDVAPDDVHLFLSPTTAASVDSRLKPRTANDADIRNFLAEDLASGCATGSKLFVYWSGHGMVRASSDHRLLFPADYRSTRPHLVFDIDEFFRRVRTEEYACFDDVIALLDTCGVRAAAPATALEPLPYKPPHKANYLIYYATPEDEFALADTGTSGFTHSALTVLRAGAGWPDHVALEAALTKRLDAFDLPRFRLSYRGDLVGGAEGEIYGRGRPSVQPAVDDLVDTLLGQNYDLPALYRAFRATTVTLGGRVATVDVEGLTGMVHELARLGDDQSRLPAGLIQFLLRARAVAPSLKSAIDGWLAANPVSAPTGVVGEEQQRIDWEGGRKLLFLFFEFDPIASQRKEPRASLRNSDMTLVQGVTFEDLKAVAFGSLAEWMRALFARLDMAGLASNLEVHVVTDPELIDEQFHRLPTLKETLGREFAVVLHYAERFNQPLSPRGDTWRDRFSDLMKLDPAQAHWREFTIDCAAKKGEPWFAGSSAGTVLNSDAKLLLRRLLHRGAPLVYWSHTGVSQELAARLLAISSCGSFPDLPKLFRESRDGGESIGEDGSLLWDDPVFLSACSNGCIAWR
jgi:vWA-MoxR associated protein C-terminal domain/Caspase domain